MAKVVASNANSEGQKRTASGISDRLRPLLSAICSCLLPSALSEIKTSTGLVLALNRYERAPQTPHFSLKIRRTQRFSQLWPVGTSIAPSKVAGQLENT